MFISQYFCVALILVILPYQLKLKVKIINIVTYKLIPEQLLNISKIDIVKL